MSEKSGKRGRSGTEGAYVHVALSVVVEAEQHEALPSAFADAPESALSRPLDFSSKFLSIFSRTCITTPPRAEPVTNQFS